MPNLPPKPMSPPTHFDFQQSTEDSSPNPDSYPDTSSSDSESPPAEPLVGGGPEPAPEERATTALPYFIPTSTFLHHILLYLRHNLKEAKTLLSWTAEVDLRRSYGPLLRHVAKCDRHLAQLSYDAPDALAEATMGIMARYA